MKFGDLLQDERAGPLNPNRVLMVISEGLMIKCLNNKGDIINLHNDKDLRITIVGSLDFKEWSALSGSTIYEVRL